MSESQSIMQLSNLSKEDLKNLAKQAQKAKRDEQAKTAKISPQMCSTMSTDAIFDAPTKVQDLDADQKKLQCVLGSYDIVANVIMQNKLHELMGVERQPSTPLPMLNLDRSLHGLPSRSLQPKSLCPDKPGDIAHIGNSVTKHSDSTKNNPGGLLMPVDVKPAKNTPASHSLHTGSVLPRTEPSLNYYSEQNQELSLVIPKPVIPVSQKITKAELGNVSVKREQTPQSNKHPMIISREPVLQCIKKEIEQSKSLDTKTVSCQPKPPPPPVFNSGNNNVKDVLQEKEHNGNCAAINGVILKDKPKLQIPEELTQHPLPLTGIQTPFDDVKFPFEKCRNVEQNGKVKVSESSSKQVLVIEEIQEKDPTSDEDSDGKSDDSHHSDKVDNQRSSVQMRVATETIEKLRQPVAPGMKEPVRAAEKTQRMESYSSNESSSSDSNSSESCSDSDNDDEPAVLQKHVKLSPDFVNMPPSPLRQKWGLKSFLETATLEMNGQNAKPPSCGARTSERSDHFDEEADLRRSSEHISDENPPSNDQEGCSKPMSADEFSPHVSEKPTLLSPLKSPQNVKSKQKVKVDDNTYATVQLHQKHDFCKSIDKKYFGSTESTKTKARRSSKLNSVSTASNESSDSESESDVDASKASLDRTVNMPKICVNLNSIKSPNFIHANGSAPPKVCSAKQKNSKPEKLLKENSKLSKSEPTLAFPTNINSCDNRQGIGNVDSLTQMTEVLSREKHVSPIRNAHVDNKLKIIQSPQTVIHKADAVSLVKPLPQNGNICATIKQPVVLVKLSINLLGGLLCIDKQNSEFLKPSIKSQKVTNSLTSSKNSLTVCKSQTSTSDRTSNNSLKQSANSLIYNCVNVKQSANNVVSDAHEDELDLKSHLDIPMQLECQSECPMKESSGDELNSNMNNEREHLRLESTPTNHKAVLDSLLCSDSIKKKRKLEVHQEDAKRRKTSTESHLKDTSTDMAKVESVVVPTFDIGRVGDHEQRNSTSSQLSTHSQHSSRSQHSSLSYKNKQVSEIKVSKSPHSQSSVKLDASANQLVQPDCIETEKCNGTLKGCDAVSSTKVHPGKSVGQKPEEDRLLRPDDYHRQAKKYKHQADSMEASMRKYMLYLEAALCFLQCGSAIEKSQSQKKLNEAFSMYRDTNKFIGHQYQQIRAFHDPDPKRKAHLKLKVLCLRIQSLVYLKLCMLKKSETMKLKQVLEEHFQKNRNVSLQPKVPSPHQTNWNKSTGTPSPMSPSPSPANSVCSVGSVGGDQTPSKISAGPGGQGQLAVSQGSVLVSPRIHSIMQQYVTNTEYMMQAHELWFQADNAVTEDIVEFFHEIDHLTGPLTLLSGLSNMVKYVRVAINKLNV